MNLQRYLGVIISVVTIIPMYYFCKIFVEKKYAIIAGILFTFNPRIIENSILGITEPIYILSIVLMLYTFFQHGKNYPYITFAIIGIISIIRYEGVLLFLPISLLYFYRYKFSKKIILKYFIAVTIFLLIIIPWGMMKIDLTGSDGMFTNVVNGPIYYSNVINDNQDPNSVIINLSKTGITNMFKFLGLSTLPLLTFLIPLGIYTMISKRKLSNFLILFSIVITLLIPAFYAYSRNFQEVRYLLPIFPIFCLFSIYFIKNITEKIKYKKLFLVLISILVISSTVGFIEYKNNDDVNQEEAYEIAKEITKLTKVITYYSQGGHLDNTRIIEANEFPILRKDLSSSLMFLYPDNYETFQEYVSNNKENGLEYVIVDKGDWRTTKFLDDVFQNEESYPYLHKIFDSKDIGYKNYHVKIFKINFEELDTLKSMAP
jgi:4-amino-4-deoxy-L-arabinose transferase-like glycosyltransferase